MIQKKLAMILLSGLAITACAKSNSNSSQANQIPTTKSNLSPEQKQQLQQLIDKTKKNLIFVKGGTYMMGDFGPEHSEEKLPYDGNPNSKPLHKVTLDDFYMSATKSTYADFDVYTNVTGQKEVGDFTEKQRKKYRIASFAAGINWQQGRSYCQWLGQQINMKMDLPTEAQWEYAARNRGQYVVFPTDNGNIDTGRNVWSFEQRQNSQEKFRAYRDISEPKQFPPTPMGFYDLITDNFEWMLDWYDPEYYNHSPEKNPQGPTTGTLKVVRSTPPSDGQSLKMFNGRTMQRYPMHPIANPEEIKDAKDLNIHIDFNYNHSVRCVANP
ncbi:hypothetical protein GCM10027155_14600 [Acinetobacter apis]|uniref:Sulfatase-modifying factor enzyme 1 n=1 Tax=Acinetobacter apis TaxID=1229165 RepID=A0A217EHX9_9GAMM|nr:SUMF1/EgtB/PvdO family nonheme iron enzyme [Acinetobacter apis]SNQ29796.1 Sulfatase-modifying factor enzyme 1 [Acinetobacter apis]